MADLVDRAFVDVDGEQIECESIDVRITGNKAPVKVMNRENRAKGHHAGVPDIAITLTFPQDLDLTTRFGQMLKDKTRFTVTEEAQGESGAVSGASYLDCEVYDVSASAREGANKMLTVEIGALDWIED